MLISILYVGIGSIKLISIIESDGMVFNSLGENFDTIIIPSYILGIGLAYSGGIFWAIIGQAIVFGILFGILYWLSLLIFKLTAPATGKRN